MVGNGAAELIKALMNQLSGKTGFIKPTFEEYPNRYHEEDSVIYMPPNRGFTYRAEDIIDFYAQNKVGSLVLVNPDNPSGNYIPREGIGKLLKWTKEKGMTFILDESFIDFADEEDSSVIRQKILDDNPHLFVIKSISKSYGVPGLRLGVLASGDMDMILRLKKEVAIWNINSFAEFYMQIEGKYEKDYIEALVKYRRERSRFQKELQKISDIRVIPSQANYVMVELIKDMTAKELTRRMLVKHRILIKDLSEKIRTGQYIRLAVRDEKDNNKLLAAFKKEFIG